MFRRKESVAGGYCANDALISAIKPNALKILQSDSRSNRIVLQITAMSFQETREETSRLFEEPITLALFGFHASSV
jgi:hypothetical protein